MQGVKVLLRLCHSLQSEPKNPSLEPVKLPKVVRSHYKIYAHTRRTKTISTSYGLHSTQHDLGLLLRLPFPFFLHLSQHTHRILGSDEYPLFGTSKGVKRWSDVEREHRCAIWLIWKSVIIDYVADFLACSRPTDYPVVSVKGRVRAAYSHNLKRTSGKIEKVDSPESGGPNATCEHEKAGFGR